MLDLNLIRVFVAVYQNSSFTQAAKQLNMSQPAVSLAVKRFEESMGYSMFVKEGRGIAPTARAAQLAEQLGAAMELINTAITSKRELVAYGVEAILHTIGDVPGVKFKLPPIQQEQALNDLRTNKVELLIDSTNTMDQAFRIEPLVEESIVVVCRVDHPRLTGDSISIEQFYHEGHVVLQARRDGYQFVDILTPEELEPRDDRVEVTALSGLALMVSRMDHIGCMPLSFAKLWAEPLGLKILPMPVDAKALPLHLVYHKRYIADPYHLKVREQIKQRLSETPVGRKTYKPCK